MTVYMLLLYTNVNKVYLIFRIRYKMGDQDTNRYEGLAVTDRAGAQNGFGANIVGDKVVIYEIGLRVVRVTLVDLEDG